MSDIVIKTEHLSKMYRLGVINNGTLFRDIQTWIALKRGKEDPHSKIGENKYSNDTDHFWALKDLNLEIKQGDRVGIIGKNGAGKSTLLKLLSRITAPTEGTIKIKGKIASLLEVGTGFHVELTGRENIYLNGAILGMKKRRITEKMDEIIAFSGIEHHIDTPVKRYSSGMYVRLAFAVAAHLDSDILIADEVLAVGDAEFQKKALGKMQDLSTGQGRTVLFVSHNMGAVKNLCNCGVVLVKGCIQETSRNIDTLISDYLNNFQKGELVSYKWKNDEGLHNLYFTPISLELQEEDGNFIVEPISAKKSYRIKLVFEVEKINSQIDYYFIFSDTDGVVLFFTRPFDYTSRCIIQKGINTVYCIIPKDILNIHNYIISLGVDIKQAEWIIDPDIKSCIIRFAVSQKGDMPITPNSIIAPQIKWII
jgi:lipopolysaccharide transport system ATP-binding protein